MSHPRQNRPDTEQHDPTETDENLPDHKTHGEGRPDEPDEGRTGEDSDVLSPQQHDGPDDDEREQG